MEDFRLEAPACAAIKREGGERLGPMSDGKHRIMNLVITTPQERYPESAVKVNKANVATRVSPKLRARFKQGAPCIAKASWHFAPILCVHAVGHSIEAVVAVLVIRRRRLGRCDREIRKRTFSSRMHPEVGSSCNE